MALTALFSAATGMQAQETNVDVISNNIANVNTTAFKRSRANFQDLLYQQISPAGAIDSSGNQIPSETAIGLGVQLVNTQREFSQGRLIQTDRDLDVALEGKGFFQVELPDDVGRGGYGYTRDGNLYVDSEGNLVTAQGYMIEPSIKVPPDYVKIVIEKDGTVLVQEAGTTGLTELGQLELAYFANQEGLESIGSNLYLETDASGTPYTAFPGEDGLGLLNQGYLESANVDLVEELVGLIRAQRAYEFNSESIKTADEMLQVLAMLRR
ncbi:MAG: flagellar basal-body rod protein FlgG [Planctomycetota bacterium]|jgi:flagellar basal-body rod protein FlgG